MEISQVRELIVKELPGLIIKELPDLLRNDYVFRKAVLSIISPYREKKNQRQIAHTKQIADIDKFEQRLDRGIAEDRQNETKTNASIKK